MKNGELTSNEFRDLVSDQFKFLEKDFGFVFQQDGDRSYVAENPYCRIRIFLEYMYPIVSLEAIGEGAKQLLAKNILPTRVGVEVIAEILGPDQEIGSSFKTIEEKLGTDIKAEITKYASFLREYCAPMFRGDFSRWSEIEDGKALRMKAFYKRFKKK